MSIRKFLNAITVIPFLAFEGSMFYLIHFGERSPDFDPYYSSIIAATAFAFLIFMIRVITARAENRGLRDVVFNAKNGNLILIAMIFTLVADYYLVAIPDDMELRGVTVFLGTQLFIFLHIMARDGDTRWRKRNIVTRIILMAVMLLVGYAILDGNPDLLSSVSMIYYANLLANALFAHRSGRGGVLLTIGLILFALCDVNVGISALDSLYVGGFPEGTLLYEIINSDIEFIWIFYIPSQTLIPMTMLLCDEQ